MYKGTFAAIRMVRRATVLAYYKSEFGRFFLWKGHLVFHIGYV
jgi:hypothetical protein